MIALLALLMFQDVPAGTDAAQAIPAERVAPTWRRNPGERILEVYPEEAWRRRIGGTARIRCQVRLDGTVTGCVVHSEEPEGMGFGAAALSLARDVRMNPATENGEPVDGASVVLPFTWDASVTRGPRHTLATRQETIRPLSGFDPEQAAFCAGLARAHAARDASDYNNNDARVWSAFYGQITRDTQDEAAREERLVRAQAEAETLSASVSSRGRLLDRCRITISGQTYRLFDPRDMLPEERVAG